MDNFTLLELARIWVVQKFCGLFGHGPFTSQEFEHDCGDVIVYGHWETCLMCNKTLETVTREEWKP